MKLTLRVDLGEGPYQVTTCLYDIVGWERKYKRKASQLSDGIGAEDLAYLAWLASKTAGMTMPLAFDDYLKKIVDLDVLDNADDFPTEEDIATS
jgi:hypothetical protein